MRFISDGTRIVLTFDLRQLILPSDVYVTPPVISVSSVCLACNTVILISSVLEISSSEVPFEDLDDAHRSHL